MHRAALRCAALMQLVSLQAALRPAIDAALNATAQNALDKTSDGGVAEEEDGPPSWMDRLAPWLTVVSEYLPGNLTSIEVCKRSAICGAEVCRAHLAGVLFFAGSVCFLLAGIYYMEKMNIGIGYLNPMWTLSQAISNWRELVCDCTAHRAALTQHVARAGRWARAECRRASPSASCLGLVSDTPSAFPSNTPRSTLTQRMLPSGSKRHESKHFLPVTLTCARS